MNHKEALQALIDGKMIILDSPCGRYPIRFVEGPGFQVNGSVNGTAAWQDFAFSPKGEYKLFEPPLAKLKAELSKVFTSQTFDAVVARAYELGARAP